MANDLEKTFDQVAREQNSTTDTDDDALDELRGPDDTEESDLQQRLKQVEYDTLGGQTCIGTISDIRGFDNTVRFTIELPSGRTFKERFEIPEVAADESELVRFLNSIGYSLSTIDHAEGADVRVRVDDGGPEAVVPEPDLSLHDRVDNIVDAIPESAGTLAYLFFAFTAAPFVTWQIYGRYHKENWNYEAAWFEKFGVWLCATMIWMFVMSVVMTLATAIIPLL